MSAPTLIAQISDLHIKRPGALAYGQVDTAAALTRCVAALNRFRPRPELVVISGDLADTPVAEEYDHLKRLLAPLEIGFAAVPGNHDSRELMRTALSKSPKGGYAQPGGALNSLHAVGSLDLILLNSSVPGKPHGELDGATLAWLDATLASSSMRPALIFLHHPPFVTGIRHMDVQNSTQHRGPRRHSAAASTRASGGRRPRPPRDADAIRRHPRDDLPGAEPCGRPRSRRKLAAVAQSRAAGLSSACLVCR